jgi:hypothetical protein
VTHAAGMSSCLHFSTGLRPSNTCVARTLTIEIQWQEHDLGEYPTIVLSWEDAMRGAPWEYIQKFRNAKQLSQSTKTGEEDHS